MDPTSICVRMHQYSEHHKRKSNFYPQPSTCSYGYQIPSRTNWLIPSRDSTKFAVGNPHKRVLEKRMTNSVRFSHHSRFGQESWPAYPSYDIQALFKTFTFPGCVYQGRHRSPLCSPRRNDLGSSSFVATGSLPSEHYGESLTSLSLTKGAYDECYLDPSNPNWMYSTIVQPTNTCTCPNSLPVQITRTVSNLVSGLFDLVSHKKKSSSAVCTAESASSSTSLPNRTDSFSSLNPNAKVFIPTTFRNSLNPLAEEFHPGILQTDTIIAPSVDDRGSGRESESSNTRASTETECCNLSKEEVCHKSIMGSSCVEEEAAETASFTCKNDNTRGQQDTRREAKEVFGNSSLVCDDALENSGLDLDEEDSTDNFKRLRSLSICSEDSFVEFLMSSTNDSGAVMSESIVDERMNEESSVLSKSLLIDNIFLVEGDVTKDSESDTTWDEEDTCTLNDEDAQILAEFQNCGLVVVGDYDHNTDKASNPIAFQSVPSTDDDDDELLFTLEKHPASVNSTPEKQEARLRTANEKWDQCYALVDVENIVQKKSSVCIAPQESFQVILEDPELSADLQDSRTSDYLQRLADKERMETLLTPLFSSCHREKMWRIIQGGKTETHSNYFTK